MTRSTERSSDSWRSWPSGAAGGRRPRLAILERLRRLAETDRPTGQLFLDDADRILWDGSEGMRPFAGRHVSEWPAEWWDSPHSMKVYGGIDPLALFGIRPPLAPGSRRGHTAQAPAAAL